MFDELLQPQEGYAVAVELDNGHTIAMRDVGDGLYEGVYTGAPAGEYSYSVTADFDGASVGRETGRFVVEKHSVEWSDIRANSALLVNSRARAVVPHLIWTMPVNCYAIGR